MREDRDYVQIILVKLWKKYCTRKLKYGTQEIRRRIMLNVSEVYRDYEKYNCDMQLKTQLNEVVEELLEQGYIDAERLAYSSDITKIYLRQERIAELEARLQEQYGVTARDYVVAETEKIIVRYQNSGSLTAYYCRKLKEETLATALEIDLVKEREILEMLDFLQNNPGHVYVREASMQVYGTSKYFEQKRYENICSIVREAIQQPVKTDERNDEILRQFYVTGPEQEISLKGNWVVEFSDYILEAKYFTGGISFSTKELAKIKRIVLNVTQIITIENKTAFYRFERNDCAAMYLGGYANRYQLQFLKQVYADNKNVHYWHFGDIDAGGFLIHQHLCDATGVKFDLFAMGVRELRDPAYRRCLVDLSENDIQRLKGLADVQPYREVVAEMLKRKVKLEQEIICWRMNGS